MKVCSMLGAVAIAVVIGVVYAIVSIVKHWDTWHW